MAGPTQLHLHRYSNFTLENRPTSCWVILSIIWVIVLLLSFSSNLSFQVLPKILNTLLFIFFLYNSSASTQLLAILFSAWDFYHQVSVFPFLIPSYMVLGLCSYFWLCWIHWILNSMCFTNGIYIPLMHASSPSKESRIHPGGYH